MNPKIICDKCGEVIKTAVVITTDKGNAKQCSKCGEINFIK